MLRKYLILSNETLIVSLISLCLSFAILKMQTSLLGLDSRGKYIYLLTQITLMTTLLRFGTNHALIKIIKDFEIHKVVSNFYLTVFVGFFLSSVFLVLLLALNFIPVSLNPWLILFFTLSTYFYTSISNFSFLVNGTQVFAFQTVFIGLINIFCLWLFNQFFRVEITHFLISSTFSQLLVSLYLIKKMPQFKVSLIDVNLIKKLYLNGLRNYIWSTLKDFSYKLDLLIFGSTMAVSDYGIYSYVQNLTQIFWKFTDPFISSFQKYLISLPYNQHFLFTKKILFYLCLMNLIVFFFAFEFIMPIFEFFGNLSLLGFKAPVLYLFISVLLINNWRIIVIYFLADNNPKPATVTMVLNTCIYLLFGHFFNNLTYAALFCLSLQLLNIAISFIYFFKSSHAKNYELFPK